MPKNKKSASSLEIEALLKEIRTLEREISRQLRDMERNKLKAAKKTNTKKPVVTYSARLLNQLSVAQSRSVAKDKNVFEERFEITSSVTLKNACAEIAAVIVGGARYDLNIPYGKFIVGFIFRTPFGSKEDLDVALYFEFSASAITDDFEVGYKTAVIGCYDQLFSAYKNLSQKTKRRRLDLNCSLYQGL